MEENKNAKRRDRIKTILIIFLLILLLLTFFSNTIMNRSLPTVSAQYAFYGQITEKVRGSGLVTANQRYEVTAEGNRTVGKVNIKPGDEIHTGDVLFHLESTQDEEQIKTLESAIEEAELAYQKALLTALPDYASQNQEIANARADLQNATRRLNDARRQGGSTVSEAAYKQAQADSKDAAKRIEKLTAYMTSLEAGEIKDLPADYQSGIADVKAALDKAGEDVAAAQERVDEAKAAVSMSSAEQEAAILTLERAAETADMAYQRAKADYEASGGDTDLRRAMEDAEQAARYAHEDVDNARAVLNGIKSKEQVLEEAETALAKATEVQTSAKQSYDTAVSALNTLLRSDLETAQQDADKAASVIESYEGQSGTSDIASLEEAVTTAERSLQNMIISLAKTQKDDALSKQIADLDLESQRKGIDKQKEELNEMKADAGELLVKSKNDGVVSSVSFAAGDQVTDGAVLAEILLTSSGYTLQFNASAEQAKKVQIGVQAEVTNNYFGDIKATLVSSKADTSNPAGSDRVLTFEITGKDTEAGQMLALSIPCSSQSYDCVVPSSAINEDKDGKFVLVVRPKNTPLGNRYYATRCNITVLAADEVNSAVQGEVNYSDFVIVTSEKPIEPGDQVRMED